MERQTTKEPQERTSTGKPVVQSYTPPVAESYRINQFYRPKSYLFEDVFPEQVKSKRPYSTTINKPRAEVFLNLSRIENFPIFFEHLAKVEIISDEQSTWQFKDEESLDVPMKLLKRKENELLVWKTEDAAGFDYTMALSLEDAQAERGTVVRVMTVYESKAAKIISIAEKLFGKDADMMARKSLQRLKAYCETGHVPTIEGQPSGRDEDSTILKPTAEETTLKH